MAYNYFEKTPVESVPAIEKEKQNATLNDGLLGDAADSFQAGALSGMGGIFDFVGAEGIAKSLYDWSDEQQKTMSESGRESLNKQFITEDANGDIAIGEGMKDIDTWILTMANVAGQFASTAVPGGGAARAVTKVASLGKKGSKAADAIGMGATGGAAGTGQGMEQARQEIQNMPDDVLADSPMFVDVLRDIHSKNPSLSGAEKWDLAKDEIARRVAQDVRTDPKVLVTNFAASAIGDPVIGKALTGARIAKNGALGSALKGFATEGATESLQAGVQQYGINEAIQPIDNRDSMKGVVAAGLNEGLAGGAFGGLAGAAGGIVNKSQDNNNKPKNEKLDSYQKQSAEVLKSGYADMVNSGMDEAEAKEAIREQQYNAAIKKGFTEEEANVAVARTMRDMFAEYSDIADIEPEQAIPDDNVAPQFQQDDALQHDQGVDYDSPTAARKAGFAETDKAAGQFGDMLTSPAQESLRALDQGNGAPSVDERVKAAAFDKTPTPDDRFSPIKYTHEGELLGPEQQAQALGVEKGPIDGFTVPEQGKLPTTEQTKNRQMREQAQAEIDAQAKGIEQKDIIFGEDGRPQQRAQEQIKQAGKDAENLLPHKDIVFAGDQSGVNVARNGLPFKTKRDALLSKEARAARRAGQKTKAIPFDNGFGWTTKDSSLKSAPNTGPDLSAENQQADATLTNEGSMPQQSESIEKTNEKPAANLAQPKGKRSTTYTPTGKQIETEFAIFDANDQSLVTSNDSAGNSNPNYPQHLQPRDRTRVSSLAQISEIANKIEPSRLGDSQETDRGAPIVKSGVVESGNGRVLAIRQAYKNGKAEKYKQFLIDNAEQFGLNKQDIEAMEAPILTRERLTELSQDELVNFTVDSNRQAGIERSPAELALTDASLFTDDELKLLNVPENGNILSSDNKAFLNSFANKLGNNEAAKYRQSDGTWNSQFAARVNNAIFAKAYDSPDLVSASSEATTKESANLINALVNGASKVAALKGPSDGTSVSNAFGQELAETVSSAANMIIKSRRDNLSIDDMISQQDAFTDRDEEAEALAKLLSKNIRSAKKMSAIINSIADDIDAALINAEQADIFTGEAQPLPSMSEVLNNAQQRFTQDKQDTSRNMGGRSATEAQQSSQTQGMASDASQGSRSGGSSGRVNADSDLEALERKVSVAEWEVKDAQKALNNIASQLKEIPGWATTGRNNRDPKLGKQIEGLTNKEQAAFKALQQAQADLAKAKNTLTGYKAGRLHANGMPKSQKAEQQQANAEYAEILKAIVKPGEQLHNVILGTPETVIKFNAKTVKVESWNGPVNRPYLDFLAMEDGKPIEVPRARELAAQNQTKPLDSGFSLPESQQSKLDNAALKISDKKRAAAEKLKKLINSRKGQFNSGIDPEVMVAVAEVGALSIAEGAIKFAQWARDVLNTTRAVGIKDEDVKPFLKEAYGAMSANPERYNIDDSTADSMDLPRNVRKFDIDTIESESNVSTTSENVEQDSRRSRDREPEHKNDDDAQSDAVERPARQAEPEAKPGARSSSEPSLSTNDGAVLGAESVNSLLDGSGNVKGTKNTGSAGNNGRGNSDDDTRTQAEHGPATATSEATKRLGADSDTKKTKQKNSHAAKWGDEKDIIASVPVLMPEQAGDIAQIEARFFGADNQGLGFQNTNGTGTGKTFVGLGAVKRFSQNGKDNSLIVVPNDGIAQQWVKAAKDFFGLDVYLIGQDGKPKTKDAGRGITIATYATLGNNNAIIKDRNQFDLIVADESQNLMGNQQAKETNALKSLRAITNHERGTYARARAMLSDKVDALNKKIDAKYSELLPQRDSAEGAKNEAKEFYSKELNALESEIRALGDKFKKQGQFDTKVLFLSATPWPYARNLDYSEGYLFNYTDYGDKYEGGYDNAFHGHNAFYIQNFGYQWRYHKLNRPGADVDESLMERTFNQTMKEKGVVGGRTLEVEADYNRVFVKVETAAGEKLDDLIEKWRDHEATKEGSEFPDRPYSELADELNNVFDYTGKVKLTEAIKAEEAANRALDHIAMGRKVVLFHSYNVGGSFDPVNQVRQSKPELMAQFDEEFPGMSDINFGNLQRPLDLFADKFGDQVRFYNGTVSDKERKIAKDLFNQDDSGVNVIVVQQEAGEAGISLHDVTGKHQRVLINIGMPVKPTQFIQIEGRTYRVGVKTDAQFENLTTGTAFERGVFASKIAGRASTAENLAMGEFARSLKENISEGYLDAEYLPAQTKIGQGGKIKDKPSEINEWDKAISLYYSNLKRNQGTKSAEGDDYFATPEPLGKKMVEWLQPMAGHRLLEPSVGHAAIGRWFPGNTRNRATEKSFKLTSLAQMNFPGDVDNIPFEDLKVINKFEGIAMNPPFGKGGKLAYDHIRKALKHLPNGGRVVALVPDGPMANKRLNAMLEDESLQNIYQAAEIDLPAGVFARAGTGVKTKIIVLDRFDNQADAPSTQYVNFTGSSDVNTLFDRIKDFELRARKQPTPVEVDVSQYMNIESPARKGRKGEDQYKIELYGYLPQDVKEIVDAEAINTFGAIPTRDERVYIVDHPEARSDLAQFIGRTIEEAMESGVKISFDTPKPKPKVDGESSNDYFEYSGETYTTKRGKEFLVTEMKDRQARDDYAALKELAKEYNGWARGQKFMFPTEDDVKQFNERAKGLLSGGDNIKFSKSNTKGKAKGVNAEQAQKIADGFIESLNGANGIKVRILATTAEAEQMWRMSLDGATVKGAYSEISNTVYVIAENIDSVTDLKQTLAHETIAHGGLDTVIGKEAKQEFINRIKKTKGRKAFEKYWKDANTDYWDMSDDVKAEEIFARFVENEPSKGELKYWWQALKRWIKAQLDKAGIMYREDDEVTAMRDMLESIVKGFKAQREPKIQQRSGLAYSQPGKKFSRTADEDTRTAKEKLGLVEQAKESVADIIKGKLNSVYETAKDSSFWNRLNEGIFDGLAGIKQAEEKAGITDINKQGYVSARLASGLADVLHGVYNYGAPQWKNGIVARKENTKGLLEVFGMLGDDLNNWLAWMGAHRAEKLKEDGRENNLTDADIAELKALGKGKEKLFEEVRKEYNKINSAILDLAEQAGLLNKQQRAAFDEEYYVPFFRDMGETDPEMDDIKRAIIEPHTRNGIAGQSAQIKALKGGGMSTKDLLENIITRQSTLIDASLKNKAMLEVVNNLDGTDFMKSENSEDIAALSQHDLNKLGKVKVMNGGKAQAYVVSDPALLRSLIQINSNGSQNLFRKLGRSAKRFLTAGVTLSPDFIFRNFVRDAAHAWMINKDDFKLGTDSFKGLKKAFKEDEAYRDLIFSGAAFQGGYVHGSDPEAGAQQMRRALRSKGLSNNQVDSYMRSIVDSGASLLEKYRNVSDKFENANRLSTYEAALKAGKSKRQAAFEAKDLMDYSLKGNFETIAFFVDMLPFFNARLQGMSKLVRASKANGDDQLLRILSANLAGKGIKLAAFSLALAAMNDDDERYQELPDWDKDMNWHVFAGEDHYRIPKPFELGVIFGTMPERLFHFGTGTQNEKDLGRAVVHAITSTMSMNPIPQFMLPATEVVMNKSFFKWAPIEGMADQNKQAEDRYNAYTSDTAKAIAQAFGVSPKKVEHLIKGYTGTLGAYVLGASDIVARQAMGIESAETPVSRYPVIKSFYQGSGPKSSTKFANEFYEALDTANQAYGSYKRAQELGDTSRIKELIENDGEKLRSRAKLAKIQRGISKLNKMQKAINDNNNLSSSQKREQLDNIQRKKNAIFHKAYIAYSLGEW
ncbi:DEAD/DEAH box helicase family protein [Pseudoalteromonas sp. SCSIO 43088]|uniref:LPD38 domain-containing protein n=1 Tax=Pseudoalteromonas sp. SCSIO 43088 TaxID=2822846 RepID=UPI00202B00BA|nr:LPD38 domain-containing protein [Pseudoalteromonas sp. SCSIO 43088]URQ87747.1 DEAD/DEAH box helicase family protein [Pseudoalteromonas sp. SCSIO 43088]